MDNKITDKRMLDKDHILKEIEAYLTFRMLGESPSVPVHDIEKIRNDIRICLKHNNIDF